MNFERLRTVWRVVASAIVLFSIGCGKSAPPQPPPPEVEVVQVGGTRHLNNALVLGAQLGINF